MASNPLLTSSSKYTRKRSLGTAFASYLRAVLRSLRFQLLPQLTRWNAKQETKKTAIYCSRVAAVLHVLLHLIPLAAALTLVILNMQKTPVYFVTSALLPSLQFAAKLLEILIQASIATTVLGFVREQVLGPTAFPFGGLIAPYRTADVSFLWSLEMWGFLTSGCMQGWSKFALWALIPAAVILAATVGPASAVLMIPRTISYPEKHRLELLNRSQLIYPQTVDLVNGTLHLESDLNQTFNQVTLGISGSKTTTVIDRGGSRTLQKSYTDRDEAGFSLLWTIPSRLSWEAQKAVYGSLILGTTFQPYAYTHCWEKDDYNEFQDADLNYVSFGPLRPYLSNVVSFTELMPDFRPLASNSSSTAMRWYSTENPELYSQVVWHELPPSMSNHSVLMVYASGPPPHSPWYTRACTVDAYWAKSTANLTDTGSPSIINEDVVKIHSRATDKNIITLTPAWTSRTFELLLNQTLNYTYHHIENTVLNQGMAVTLALSMLPPARNGVGILNRPMFNKTYSTPEHEMRLTSEQYASLRAFVEAERRRQKYDEIQINIDNTDWADPTSLAQIDLRSYSAGYGYDTSTVPVQLSLAVLLLYISATFASICYTIVTGRVASSWNSVAELASLALNSQRPKGLENTSVGIETIETFRRPVNVRVNADMSTEIVFVETNASGTKGSTAAGNYADVVANENY